MNDAAHRLGMSYFSVITSVVAIALSGILAKLTPIPGEGPGARLWELGARLGVARPSARDVERRRRGEIGSVSGSRTFVSENGETSRPVRRLSSNHLPWILTERLAIALSRPGIEPSTGASLPGCCRPESSVGRFVLPGRPGSKTASSF